MNAHSIVAVVPMKPLNRSKTRLASVLSEQQRADLSLSMFSRVISAANAALGMVWVVGGDDTVRHTAERLGALWREDPGRDLNDSLSIAFDEACKKGLAPIYLPADLPFVTAADIEKIVQVSSGGETLTLSPRATGRRNQRNARPQVPALSALARQGQLQPSQATSDIAGHPLCCMLERRIGAGLGHS